MSKKVGILTGGGDCQGLNPVIRAVVRKGIEKYGFEFVGIKNGWKGMLEKETMPVDLSTISGILRRGGTILGTSRTNPGKSEELMQKVIKNFNELGLYALVAIGGDDTLGVANKMFEKGLKVVGVPKTIDNDLSATDMTFGFDTAVQIASDAIDRLQTTAESHQRVLVVEVMGRHAGWIATYSGIASGADVILIPEEPFHINDICKIIDERTKKGKTYSLIVVAEGAVPDKSEMVTKDEKIDDFGHVTLGGIGEYLSKKIKEKTGIDTRLVVLGHIQRGGVPTAFDRVLSTRYGVKAIDLVHEGKFGKMAALRGNEIIAVDLKEAVSKLKLVDKELFDVAKIFFG